MCEIESSSNRVLQLNAIDFSELAAIWILLVMLPKKYLLSVLRLLKLFQGWVYSAF